MVAHDLGIGDQFVVDGEPDLDMRLPGRLHSDLGHTAAGRVFETEPGEQG
jgi:hypothetical protein